MSHALVRVDTHHVPAQDGCIFRPFLPHGLMAAAERVIVHDIVMDEGEGVEHFQPCGRFQNSRSKFLGINTIGGEAQARAQALSANGDHIAERVVQPGGMGLELNMFK